MIERIDDMPPGTLGFRASGKIEREDYVDVLVPELHKAVEAGKLRTLYVVEKLEEMEPSALWADAKLGYDLGVTHRDAWERSAIVSDIDWIVRSTRLFLWMVPGEARLYPTAELDEAKRWVAGGAR